MLWVEPEGQAGVGHNAENIACSHIVSIALAGWDLLDLLDSRDTHHEGCSETPIHPLKRSWIHCEDNVLYILPQDFDVWILAKQVAK